MGLLELLLIVLLVIAIAGAGPWWGYSRSWGYPPMGILVVIILVVLLLRLV